jgi:hypothetical protein
MNLAHVIQKADGQDLLLQTLENCLEVLAVLTKRGSTLREASSVVAEGRRLGVVEEVPFLTSD